MILNCWEAKKCGRQPGGERCDELGICPAAIEKRTDGMNSGINGGRTCWAIQKTLCGDKVQGGLAEKLNICLKCDFYAVVRREEAPNFSTSKEILTRLNEQRS